MELSDLVTFSAVARTGGVTRAAEELNTVQSNITQRVKALEAEIGTPLFERHSRGMTLTGAAAACYPTLNAWRRFRARPSWPLARTASQKGRWRSGRWRQPLPCACPRCSLNFTGVFRLCN
jgi:hypothetical protein